MLPKNSMKDSCLVVTVDMFATNQRAFQEKSLRIAMKHNVGNVLSGCINASGPGLWDVILCLVRISGHLSKSWLNQ